MLEYILMFPLYTHQCLMERSAVQFRLSLQRVFCIIYSTLHKDLPGQLCKFELNL